MEVDGERLTPLDYAVIGQHQELAQLLIEHGALSISAVQDLAAICIQKVCLQTLCLHTLYMEIHVHSTLALRNQKEKKGEVTHPTIAQTNIYTCS